MADKAKTDTTSTTEEIQAIVQEVITTEETNVKGVLVGNNMYRIDN